jgi:hypothetical protein
MTAINGRVYFARREARVEILNEVLANFKRAHLNDGEFTSGEAIRFIERMIREEMAP